MNARAAAAPRGHGVTKVPDRLWVAMLMRAVPAAVVALVVTFTQLHTASFGFLAFGSFALASGVLIGFEAIGIPHHPARGLTFARSIVSALAGGLALIFGAIPHLATPGWFIWHVAVWAIVTGLIELISAWVVRRMPLFSREVLISGALTLILGVLVAIVPPDLNQAYGGVENIEGALTASVQSIGLFGAYAAILAVVLIVEAVTLRSITRRSTGVDAVDAGDSAATGSARGNGVEA